MKRIIVLFMVAVMLLSVVACAKTDENDDGNRNNDQENEGKIWVTKEYDFGGDDFVILADPSEGKITGWDGADIDVEALTGNEVLDEVYNRNRLIEEKYNCKIVNAACTTDSIKTTLMSGSDSDGSMISIEVKFQFPYIEAGLLMDLNNPELVNLNLDKPWYSQASIKDTTIKGKTYCVDGDMLFTDENAAWITLFNKDLAAKYLPDVNLYDMVREGTWTIDNLIKFAKLATEELVADDKWTYKDQWGYVGEAPNFAVLLAASGYRLAEVTSDGNVQLNVYDTEFQNAFYKILEAFDKSFSIIAQDITVSDEGTGHMAKNAMFQEGRGLFTTTAMNRVIMFREMETDFGVLPNAKLDPEQKEYYTWTTYNCNMVSIPLYVQDCERVSAIMEALFEESSYYLKPAYIDKALKYQGTRDDESVEMLEIIMENFVYDIGVLYDFGGTYSAYLKVTTNRTPGTLISSLKKTEGGARAAIQKLVERLEAAP